MKSGITLVEIMIVIAVCGILAAIAIPNMLKSKEEQKRKNDPRIERTVPNYQFNGHSFVHDPNCGCHKYGKLRD